VIVIRALWLSSCGLTTCINYTIVVRHSQGPPSPGSAIPRVRQSQGPPFLESATDRVRSGVRFGVRVICTRPITSQQRYILIYRPIYRGSKLNPVSMDLQAGISTATPVIQMTQRQSAILLSRLHSITQPVHTLCLNAHLHITYIF
jgi:hypothetical protein